MKRIALLAALLFVFALASGFADDQAAPALTFSGSLFSGLEFDGSASAVTAKLWDTDNGDPEDVWFDGALNGKLAGLKFEFYTSDGTNAKVDVLYGWWKPIDMITISGGEGVGDLYTTPIEGWDASSGSGFQVAVVPITGLQIGLWYAAGLTAANVDITSLSFTGSYDMAKIAKVGVGYGSNFFWGGLSLKAVAGLKTNVDFEYYLADNANGSTTAANTYRGELDAGYTVASFSGNVWAFLSSKTGDAAWGVKPYVSYVFGLATPGAYFEYNADATWSTGVNLAVAVEKQTMYLYADYKSASTWDLGVNFRCAF